MSDISQKEWRSKDGLRIPHYTNPLRHEWNTRYQSKLADFFNSGKLTPMSFPVGASASGHYMPPNPVGPGGRDRRGFYTRMIAGGDMPPPIVVKRNGLGWHILDGNARLEAAKASGLPNIPAFEFTEGDQSGPLVKMMHPDDMAKLDTDDANGRDVVDYQPDLKAHPPMHQASVDAFNNMILDSPTMFRNEGVEAGMSAKNLYTHPSTTARYIVKPYYEALTDRLINEHHLRKHIHGWAEMTHQALYHASGIGHLHQQVHVAVDTAANGRTTPMLVIQRAPHPWEPMIDGEQDRESGAMAPLNIDHVARLLTMDMLTGNIDRHSLNCLAHPNGHLMSIDHSLSFQYPKEHDWSPYQYFSNLMFNESHQPGYYEFTSAMHRARQQWFLPQAGNMLNTLISRLPAIKNSHFRDHIKANFYERLNHLGHRIDFSSPSWYDVPITTHPLGGP
jgi:hypothetical protein